MTSLNKKLVQDTQTKKEQLEAQLNECQEEIQKQSRKLNKIKFEKEELEIIVTRLNEDADNRSRMGETQSGAFQTQLTNLKKRTTELEVELDSANTMISLFNLFEDTIYFMSEANYATRYPSQYTLHSPFPPFLDAVLP